MNVDLKRLVDKLNPSCRKTLESAAGLCRVRAHYDVDLEHWFLKLVEEPGIDANLIFERYSLQRARLISDLTKALDAFKTGNARVPTLSQIGRASCREGM